MTDRLQQIFEKQAGYMRTLAPIYAANGFQWHSDFPYPLDERWAQEGFRLLAWRATEEVYEALEKWGDGSPSDDYREEVSDILHFLVELAICSGVTAAELATGGDVALLSERDYLDLSFERVQLYRIDLDAQRAWGLFLTALAQAMMDFRQRPWRTDNRPTDREKFVRDLAIAWFSFCTACVATDIGPALLCRHYFEKQIINKERRDSNMPKDESEV